MKKQNIATLVLMGGQNKRMNGEHKAFLTLNQKTFLDTIVEHLFSFSKIYLSVNDKNKFNHLTLPLIEDKFSSIGPINGIYSALKTVPEDYLFVTACDMPFMTAEFAKYMVSHLHSDAACFALTNEEGFFFTMGAIYSKACLPYIEEMLQNKHYSLQQLIKKSPSQRMALSNTPFSKKVLVNINTPEDYHLYSTQIE